MSVGSAPSSACAQRFVGASSLDLRDRRVRDRPVERECVRIGDRGARRGVEQRAWSRARIRSRPFGMSTRVVRQCRARTASSGACTRPAGGRPGAAGSRCCETAVAVGRARGRRRRRTRDRAACGSTCPCSRSSRPATCRCRCGSRSPTSRARRTRSRCSAASRRRARSTSSSRVVYLFGVPGSLFTSTVLPPAVKRWPFGVDQHRVGDEAHLRRREVAPGAGDPGCPPTRTPAGRARRRRRRRRARPPPRSPRLRRSAERERRGAARCVTVAIGGSSQRADVRRTSPRPGARTARAGRVSRSSCDGRFIARFLSGARRARARSTTSRFPAGIRARRRSRLRSGRRSSGARAPRAGGRGARRPRRRARRTRARSMPRQTTSGSFVRSVTRRDLPAAARVHDRGAQVRVRVLDARPLREHARERFLREVLADARVLGEQARRAGPRPGHALR